MARSLRDLRRKMKAITSTRQVTKAMELVAASKMRRAVSSAQTLRRYALTAWRILENIAEVHPDAHPYLAGRTARKILAILFTSDRGLCGSLNANMFRQLQRYIHEAKELPSFELLHFVAIGRRGQKFLARSSQNVVAAFPAISNHPTFRDVLPVVRLCTESFLDGTYDHVVLLYPNFISALVQQPALKVLLPFSKTELKEMLGELTASRTGPQSAEGSIGEYLFEPSQSQILETILPQLTEVQVYQAVLEAAASEHSARMVAMRSATDNATDLLGDLTLTYNQTRQANITGELAELSAAAAAMG